MLDTLSGNADDVLDLFKKIHDSKRTTNESGNKPANDTKKDTEPVMETDTDLTRIFVFDSLNKVIRLSGLLADSIHSENALYKDEQNNTYLLVITKGTLTAGEFNRACNVLSEYGSAKKMHQASHSYLEEHFLPLIAKDALKSLAKMN